MRFYFFLFLFAQLFAFGQTISKEDSIKKQQDLEERIKIFQERIKYYNERCSKDSLRAVADSKTQNKYYIYNSVPSDSDFPAKKELQSLLQNHNISWGGIGSGSDLPHHYTTDKCYHRYMNVFTEKKFGEDFMLSLVRQSLLEYINKNPSIIFEYNEHLDWIYDNNDAIADEMINKLFFKNFIYPKGYKSSLLKNASFTIVQLNFDYENHKLLLESFEHHIDDNHNKQFIPYLERKIKDFINSPIFVLSENSGRYDGVKTSFKIYYK
ncbi:hypothetical protein ATE47_14785 [Chryseobacterium sp. IHB B 17019]|uniref:hypothetical protein n=1 Tax=Chryseobacterium sp. IHB B 17019 TaxID=1721091 RepID=UPI000720DB59|nr:hypothetical protein [Chryseobacterium sp. IHB B 17019]ALR31698.1 hypothetical protein ATE47_14785 [Chryseobacterium sp. IHB B 17019]